MFQGAPLRLVLSRVLWAFCFIGCLTASAQAERASTHAAGSAAGAVATVAAAHLNGERTLGQLAARGADLLAERNLDEFERRMPSMASAALPPPATKSELGFARPEGDAASCFGHRGARPGRGAKGARDPGEVQRELPAG